MNTIYNLIAVFIGSGIGGACRWALAIAANGQHPLGTFAANVAGCFIIGLLSSAMPLSTAMRLLLVTGFCGGFTTFSTFINENLLLMRGGQLVYALVYATGSIIAGLAAAWAGYNLRIK